MLQKLRFAPNIEFPVRPMALRAQFRGDPWRILFAFDSKRAAESRISAETHGRSLQRTGCGQGSRSRRRDATNGVVDVSSKPWRAGARPRGLSLGSRNPALLRAVSPPNHSAGELRSKALHNSGRATPRAPGASRFWNRLGSRRAVTHPKSRTVTDGSDNPLARSCLLNRA
jgi:hypothetical protein